MVASESRESSVWRKYFGLERVQESSRESSRESSKEKREFTRERVCVGVCARMSLGITRVPVWRSDSHNRAFRFLCTLSVLILPVVGENKNGRVLHLRIGLDGLDGHLANMSSSKITRTRITPTSTVVHETHTHTHREEHTSMGASGDEGENRRDAMNLTLAHQSWQGPDLTLHIRGSNLGS
jgi:hypothetical protein